MNLLNFVVYSDGSSIVITLQSGPHVDEKKPEQLNIGW